MKKFCGDAVADALRAIGRRRGDFDPAPWDFTEEERFRMFRHLMREHVYPCADSIWHGRRCTYSWTHSAWSWRHGGKRRFAERVRKAAQAELAAADYTEYDLSQIRCLVGDDGPRFCRLLAAEDAAVMEQRIHGMETDLAVIDGKLEWLRKEKGAFGELRYRIALYNHTYEAVIRGGRGGWIWQNLA